MNYEFPIKTKSGKSAVAYVTTTPFIGDDGRAAIEEFRMFLQVFENENDPDGIIYPESKYPFPQEWDEIEAGLIEQILDNDEEILEQLKIDRGGPNEYF